MTCHNSLLVYDFLMLSPSLPCSLLLSVFGKCSQPYVSRFTYDFLPIFLPMNVTSPGFPFRFGYLIWAHHIVLAPMSSLILGKGSWKHLCIKQVFPTLLCLCLTLRIMVMVAHSSNYSSVNNQDHPPQTHLWLFLSDDSRLC